MSPRHRRGRHAATSVVPDDFILKVALLKTPGPPSPSGSVRRASRNAGRRAGLLQHPAGLVHPLVHPPDVRVDSTVPAVLERPNLRFVSPDNLVAAVRDKRRVPVNQIYANPRGTPRGDACCRRSRARSSQGAPASSLPKFDLYQECLVGVGTEAFIPDLSGDFDRRPACQSRSRRRCTAGSMIGRH